MEEQRARRERLKLSGRRPNGAPERRVLEVMEPIHELWGEEDQLEYEQSVGLYDGAILQHEAECGKAGERGDWVYEEWMERARQCYEQDDLRRKWDEYAKWAMQAHTQAHTRVMGTSGCYHYRSHGHWFSKRC